MTAQHVGFFVPHAIGLVAATVVTLIGFRKIGPKPGKHAGADRWHAKFGPLFKIGGPLLVMAVLALAIVVPPSANWSRHTTTDGACSVEFPRSPRHEIQTHNDVPTDTLEVGSESANTHFSLSFSDLSAKDAALPPDQLFPILRNIYMKPRPEGLLARVIKEQVLEDRGFQGREYQFAVGDQFVTRIKVFVSGRRVYRAITVNPPGTDADRNAQRFIDSFRFEITKP